MYCDAYENVYKVLLSMITGTPESLASFIASMIETGVLQFDYTNAMQNDDA